MDLGLLRNYGWFHTLILTEHALNPRPQTLPMNLKLPSQHPKLPQQASIPIEFILPHRNTGETQGLEGTSCLTTLAHQSLALNP